MKTNLGYVQSCSIKKFQKVGLQFALKNMITYFRETSRVLKSEALQYGLYVQRKITGCTIDNGNRQNRGYF